MKKLIFGLLVIAAGTASYFLFFNKKKPGTENSIDKELLLGAWVPAGEKDSSVVDYRYQFESGNRVIRAITDSLQPDTLTYKWKNNSVVEITSALDSIPVEFKIAKLTKDTLAIRVTDSTSKVFTRP